MNLCITFTISINFYKYEILEKFVIKELSQAFLRLLFNIFTSFLQLIYRFERGWKMKME